MLNVLKGEEEPGLCTVLMGVIFVPNQHRKPVCGLLKEETMLLHAMTILISHILLFFLPLYNIILFND